MVNHSTSRQALALYLLFCGSGCAALIYEIVWFQVLQLVIGSSPISVAALLVSFMGGMGLGSIALPRFVPWSWHPLRVYAGLELAIGIIGGLLLLVLPAVRVVYLAAVGYGLGGVLLRAAVCVACLLPPTVLMGATLPAAARWAGTSRAGVGRIGRFYAANTAGAVLGVLVASFYLLRVYDTVVATFAAVAVNAVVAVVAVFMARSSGASRPAMADGASMPVAVRAAAGGSDSGAPPAAAAAGRAPLAVIFLSGFAAIGAEVVWTRQLSLLFGATVYNFSLILAVFLAGIGLGSAGGARVAARTDRPGAALGWCQIGLLALVPYAAGMIGYRLPLWLPGPEVLSWEAGSPWYRFLYDLARCAIAIGPATLCWGASFPLALAAANTGEADAGRLVARVSVRHTAGALAGAVLFSLVLIPGLGTRHAQQVLVLAAAAGAGLLFLRGGGSAADPGRERPRRAPRGAPGETPRSTGIGAASARFAYRRRGSLRPGLVAAAVSGAAAIGLMAVPASPPGLIAFGRDVEERETIERYLFVDEGVNASVAVSDSRGGYRQLHISGKVVASTMDLDLRLERMLGHVPALVHGAPRTVLVVGLGAGITAGAFTRYPEVERIVICEIEPKVSEASDRFAIQNHAVLLDPRTELIYDDARHFLATTDEQFDVVTSDPIHPWVRGAASLYSVEYHDLVRRRLRPGGVVAQWVPLYETDEAAAKSQIATFAGAYPDATLWSSGVFDEGYDLVLLGHPGPPRVDGQEITRRLAGDPDLQDSLGEVGLGSTLDLLRTYAGRASDLEPWLRDAEINRDRNLRLQYLAGLSLDRQDASGIYRSILRYRRYPPEIFRVPANDEAALRLAF